MGKLTREKVIQARRYAKSGGNVAGMARKLGVHAETLRQAIKGRNWKSVDAVEPPMTTYDGPYAEDHTLRDLPNHVDYKACSCGLIWSRHFSKSWRVVQGWSDQNGYRNTMIADSQAGKYRAKIHRLVYAACVGKLIDGLEIAHLDGNPTNNNATNLAQVTHLENMRHCVEHGTRVEGSAHPKAKLTDAQVLEIRQRWQSNHVTQTSLANEYGVSSSTMSRILTKRTYKNV